MTYNELKGVSDMVKTGSVIGRAYGFFDCKASKAEIEGVMPAIRKYASTPQKVDISIYDDMSRIQGDQYLMGIAKKAGMKYAMEVSYPDADNRKTADEAAAVLNQAYQTPLFDEGEPFRGEIVFEENGNYVFRD